MQQPTNTPGALSKKESELRANFLYQVSNIPGGKKISKCIQCGTCTGSCPVSYMMDITPREVIALFRAGDIESILNSRTIWICASCYGCTVRCPSGIKVTDILYALKRVAMDKGLFPKNFPVHALSKSFVYVMNMFGRSFEPGLIALYYMKTGPLKLFKMMPFAYKMWKKGRISMFPTSIKGKDGFKKIMKEAQLMENLIPVEVIEPEIPTTVKH
ncbi:MAG: hypothetical protein A2Y62_08210 [Candidatus Fischerbacteria bacterium RBG_13_37_8]|uniref:4Fe-4S ferredoxin-type domain-containing protein n=1 Tax=Candidatus Fischerbacteria bacterium RBG_13_37_8 TaxID=1817863 RepID=A0A1F5V8B1_9BACT|nr:MAG: hypothetical protein A2Y62_08210 [Candidatus Fischerbacteria bacterium RBG_13_37_8]